MYIFRIKESFSAAHCLPNYDGACGKLHGHSFVVEAEFQFQYVDSHGMCMDFLTLKKKLKAILPDHSYLNEQFPKPTSEALAKHFYRALKFQVSSLKAITVWGSPDCGVTYYE